MKNHIEFIGFVLILLALVHSAFPKYFNWKKELSALNLINKQMMLVHTFFIALTVLLMGLLCVFSTENLIETTFGKQISFGLGLFWGARLFVQFFVYSPKLWRGKRLETTVHVVFSALWIYITAVFFANTLT